jgi:hypothetical protein
LLQLPVELRISIYEFVYHGSGVKVVSKRRQRDLSRTVHGIRYQGAFSLFYTCRQIHHEASVLTCIEKLVTFDFTGVTYINKTVLKPLGTKRARSVRTIWLSTWQVNSIAGWARFVSERPIEEQKHFARGLFPALVLVKVREKKDVLMDGPETVRDALRLAYGREGLEVDMS